jgi:hypothetical protein
MEGQIVERTEWPRRQIGIRLDMGLWRSIKMIALEQDRTATEVLEDAMREYIDRHHPVILVTNRPGGSKMGDTVTRSISKSGKKSKEERRK